MCRFCVEHGEGERWYLQAVNYAYDLESDVRRRDYVVGFVSGFGQTRENTLGWMDRLGRLPGPLERASKNAISRHMQANHFGQPLSIEDCERVFDLASSITVIPCVCRMHEPGKDADDVCILVTTQPVDGVLADGFSGYEDGPDLGDFHTLKKAEAMELLRTCEQQGLMHSIWTFQTPFTAAICNCNLESGCMAMKLTTGHKLKMMWRGEDVARIDEDACTGCGACAKLCPFDAIEIKRTPSRTGARKVAVQSLADCWGCGICRAGCPTDAISLCDRRNIPQVAALW